MNSVSSVSCSLYDYKACIFSRSCQVHATYNASKHGITPLKLHFVSHYPLIKHSEHVSVRIKLAV